MPTGTRDNDYITLNDFQSQKAVMQFTEPTSVLAVAANYTLSPGGKYTTRGGSVEVELMDSVRNHIKRDIPRLTTGFGTDTTAKVNFSLSAQEVSTNKATGVTSIGTTDQIGLPFSLFDTRWPFARLNTGAPVVLSNRSYLATLPITDAPISLSVYSDVNAERTMPVVGPVGGGTGFEWKVTAGQITNIAMGYDTATDNKKTITIAGREYTNIFSDCLTHLLLGKEEGGNYLAVGFNEDVTQPTSQNGYQRTYPQTQRDVSRPFRPGPRQTKNLQLIRDNIRGHERDTFRAFMECMEFWLWVPELNDYRSIELSFGNSLDEATTELTANITINAY